METGNVNWAIQLYIDLKRKERAVETTAAKLQSWLGTLNEEQFSLYVKKTMEIDSRESERILSV